MYNVENSSNKRIAVHSRKSVHLFLFPLTLCVLCAVCACVNKCTDGIRAARAGKAAVGVAATLCLSFFSQAVQRKCNMT